MSPLMANIKHLQRGVGEGTLFIFTAAFSGWEDASRASVGVPRHKPPYCIPCCEKHVVSSQLLIPKSVLIAMFACHTTCTKHHVRYNLGTTGDYALWTYSLFWVKLLRQGQDASHT